MPDLTPAQELAAAADRLDMLLAEVTSEAWEFGIVVDGGGDGHSFVASEADAAYIAAMRPQVGRAVVALLRAACDGNDIDGYEPQQVEHYFGEELAVARAILATKEANHG